MQIYAEVPTVDMGGAVGRLHAAEHERADVAVSAAKERQRVDDVYPSLKVIETDPVGALVDAAADADLLVVGSRGGGAARRGLRGSVSAGCLHHVSIPVAVVSAEPPLSRDRWLRSRVLVGYDGSPAADAALAWGVAQARGWECPLVPIIVSESRVNAPLGLAADVSAHGGSLSSVLMGRLEAAQSAGLTVHPRYLVGAPADQLRRSTRPEDLLILGSRGHGTLASLLMGSTSLSVAESAPCLVVVVRAAASEPTPVDALVGAVPGP